MNQVVEMDADLYILWCMQNLERSSGQVFNIDFIKIEWKED